MHRRIPLHATPNRDKLSDKYLAKPITMVLLPALLPMLLFGCATTGDAKDGIVMVTEDGQNKTVSAAEVEAISNFDQAYYLQVGDVVNLDFKVKSASNGEPDWTYRIEVGDSIEVKFLPSDIASGEYKLESGDVIGIAFLDNWQLNVNRTVRPDGMITALEVGDLQAKGRTSIQLRDKLKEVYSQSELLGGEARISVNVDFVNLDRYEDLSRTIVVRPDGAIRLPGINTDLRIGGLTVEEATDLIRAEVVHVLRNPPQVSMLVFAAVDTSILSDMTVAAQVRPDGKISVPRVGEVHAAGYSIEELTEVLQQATVGIINNPLDTSVDLLKSTGGRFYVGGEVGTPGVYPIEGAPTILQALFLANGFNDSSRLNNVILMRRNPKGKPFVFKTNLRVAMTRGNTENDILLRPFDIVFVPKKTISKVNLFVEQYIDKVVPFDNSLGINAQYYLNDQNINTGGPAAFGVGTKGVAGLLRP